MEGAPGHGEGHNSGQALIVTAALAVKKIMERENIYERIKSLWDIGEQMAAGFRDNISGGQGHNWNKAIAMATPIAHKEATTGAKVHAMTVLDLLLTPSVLEGAWDYFNNVQTKDQQYVSLLRPQDGPAIWLNKETMERFKPELEQYYYDPSTYDTYLEQLGIKYPTTRE